MDADGEFLRACSDPRVRLVVERFGCTTVSRDWGLDRRLVDEHYLVHVLCGNAIAAGIEGCRQRIGRGGMLWFGPGCAHDLVPIRRPFRMYHLRFQLFAGRRSIPLPGGEVIIPQSVDLQQTVGDIFREWHAGQAWSEICFRGRLTALCGELLRRRSADGTAGERRLNEGQRARIFAWLDKHLPGPVQPAGLIAMLGLSHDYGTRLFRATFGMPPRTWLMHERIRRAADELAHSNASIEAVSDRWGFSGQHVFSRQFRQVLGTSPSAWRKRA